ncbi:DUF2470 domain-containing protein [Prochlorococcus sp. MIT 1307]|uniref:DUF2470 domain-containing protein n=1 Tax=Prochlorococcus sp. MIT 1307 TaxID=3096219 RepID=UPI002A75AC26|nr:DUF2470 domain-containing protein [Prochlorococcus sp. MIT 1307]
MKATPLTPDISKRICNHMNADHQEALIQYAKHFGGVVKPKQVKMIDLNPIEMKLEVDGDTVNIAFDHRLIDSSDAHRSLVAMLEETPNRS